MQIINQIGHIQHWGLSPAVDLLKNWQQYQANDKPLRILLSGCSDIRHILKTLCDVSQAGNFKRQIQFYFHQTKVELICRMLLFIHILHQTHLNYDQRTQLYLDLFANAMIKERNARYLHLLKEDLLNFIHSEDKVHTPLKHIVNLKHLKFQERDEMSQFVQSWSLKADFDMQKCRDQKLRYLFKERYDFRNNLIDWDYSMNLLPSAPIVHFYHYKQWRLSGLAYEQRFSTYSQPNRTLASYAQGKRKQSRTTCLVRGYWGDIVMSPYVSIGVRCDYPQKQLLFKKANHKYIGHAVELSIYNMIYWLNRLEQDKQYVRAFKDYYRTDEKTKKQLESIDKKQNKQNESLKQIQQAPEEEIEEKQKQKEPQQQKQKQEVLEQTQKEAEKQDVKQKQDSEKTEEKMAKKKKKKNDELDSDEQRQKQEVEQKNSKQIQIAKMDLPVLKGFSKFNVQIFPLAMSPDVLLIKSTKFIDFFDVICLGFSHSAYLKKERNIVKLLKEQGKLFLQRSTFLVPKKKQQRQQLDKRLLQLAGQYKQMQKISESQEVFVFEKGKIE